MTHLLVAAHDQNVAVPQGGESDPNTGSVQCPNNSVVEVAGVHHTDCLGPSLQKVTIQVDVVPCMGR